MATNLSTAHPMPTVPGWWRPQPTDCHFVLEPLPGGLASSVNTTGHIHFQLRGPPPK